MTLIVGLRCADSVIVAAEGEEQTGITAKRNVSKIGRVSGDDWTVVFGAAGDSFICENAMRRLTRMLQDKKSLTEDQLTDAIDSVLEVCHTKYIDPVPHSEGIALVIGAVCGNNLYLISTHKRTYQFQDYFACVGYGADLAIYFCDRLHSLNREWKYGACLATFVLKEVKESSQACGGDSLCCIVQTPPNPRWRVLGQEFMMELESSLGRENFIEVLAKQLSDIKFDPKKWAEEEDEWFYQEEEQKP